jgi:hypothetical protein
MEARLCIGPSTGDAVVERLVKFSQDVHGATCSKRDVHLRPDGVTVDLVCSDKTGGTVSTHAEITEPSSEAFHEITLSDHVREGFKMKSSIDGNWLGACPAGMPVGSVSKEPADSPTP